MNMSHNCNRCNHCDKDRCKEPCGCAEPVFSIEAMSDDPAILRFNVNGKSIWYDFTSLVNASQSCTSLNTDAKERTLNYLGECNNNTITAKELGAILHLADIGDIDATSIKDNGILNYQTTSDCPEGCEGTANGWRADNPIDLGTAALSYIIGSDANGKMQSLMPPSDASSFSYLAWAAGSRAKWVKPTIVSTPPVKDGYRTRLWLDENTGEIVATREAVE